MKGKPQLRISQIQEVKELPVKKSGSGMREGPQFTLPKWDYHAAVAHYKDASYYLMTYKHTPTGNKRLLALDFQIALITLAVIKLNPNNDNQLPTELVRYVWNKVANKLEARGHQHRGFDCNRWAAIRNTMSDCQFLNWFDNRYWFSEQDDEVGQAMKWELKAQYCYNPESTSTQQQKEEHTHIDKHSLKAIVVEIGLRPELYLKGRYDPYDWAMAEAKMAEIFG
jgi:hypothetical protein